MKRCEVLADTVIACQKGSIVFVTDRQFELARKILKPVEAKQKIEAVEIETAEAPKVKKTRTKKQ